MAKHQDDPTILELARRRLTTPFDVLDGWGLARRDGESETEQSERIASRLSEERVSCDVDTLESYKRRFEKRSAKANAIEESTSNVLDPDATEHKRSSSDDSSHASKKKARRNDG